MTETLDQTIAIKAEEWTTADLETIVAGLRAQRSRWNIEQSKGSRKLVKSNAVSATPKKKVSTKGSKLRGIKL